MKRRVSLISALFSFLSLASPTFGAQAQLFVSRAGNDRAICKIAQPCRSIQRALDLAADGGEIEILDVGPYQAFEIHRSVSLKGHHSVISCSRGKENIPICVSIGPDVKNVLLDSLWFDGTLPPDLWFLGQTYGVEYVGSGSLRITDSVFREVGMGIAFHGDNQSSLTITGTNFEASFHDCGWAMFSWVAILTSGGSLSIDKSSIKGYGIGVRSNSAHAAIADSVFDSNATALYILKDERVEFSRLQIARSRYTGILYEGTMPDATGVAFGNNVSNVDKNGTRNYLCADSPVVVATLGPGALRQAFPSPSQANNSPSGGKPNGASCAGVGNQACASRNCINGVCAGLKPGGASCFGEGNQICVTKNCVNDICVALKPDGASCLNGGNQACTSRNCVNNVCITPRHDGASCADGGSQVCASKNCVNNVCTALKPNGESCFGIGNQACASKNCVNGVCQP